MPQEIPIDILGAMKSRTFNQAIELSLEGRLSRSSWDAFLNRVEPVAEQELDDADKLEIERFKRSTNREDRLRLVRARRVVAPLLDDPDPRTGRYPSTDIDPYLNALQGTQAERLLQAKRELVAAVETYIDSDTAALSRYISQAEMQTLGAQDRIFTFQASNLLQLLNMGEIKENDADSWLTFRQIRERLSDGIIAGAIDPKGYGKAVGFIAFKSERLRIFVPDQLRLYVAEAAPALKELYKSLKPATDADGGTAERAMHAGLEGKHLRALVSCYWKPTLLLADRFEQTQNGLWLAKDVKKKSIELSARRDMDFWTGNDVEYREVSPDVPLLMAEEDISIGGVSYQRGDQFSLLDPGITDEFREGILNRKVKASFVLASGMPDPKAPERLIPGEWLLTLEDIFKEYEGGNPRRDRIYLRHGIDPTKIVGHETTSGSGLEANSVLRWDDDLLLAIPPEKRGELVGTDLVVIKAGEFNSNALLLLAVTQYDAFFDPACRKKQHLETSMRSVIPDEYVWRHAITDIDLRDITMSMFGALVGRKINLNAYNFALYQGLDIARGKERHVVPKRIDDMTDPYQLENQERFLGPIQLHRVRSTTDPGVTNEDVVSDKKTMEAQRRILEHYAISRREYPGQHHDIHEVNRIYHEARWIANQFAKGLVNRAGMEARLAELRVDVLKTKRVDYLQEDAGGGYYWEKRSPFEHPRPGLEQVAMMNAMGEGEAEIIRDVSHKDLIVSLGGRDDLPDWCYEGWYGKMLALKYANSMGFFFWGDDVKQEQMQLKYMSVAGKAFAGSLDAARKVVQSLDPSVLGRAGFNINPKAWGDELGEVLGHNIAHAILNEGFGLSGKETVGEYFKNMAEVMLGRAGALSHLPGDAQKRTMMMYLKKLQTVVEGGVQYHWKKKIGLGSPGTEGQLLTLDFGDPVYGEVEKWLVGLFRERGDEVIFPEGEKPYISAQGRKVVYAWEGIIDPSTGKWIMKDITHLPLRERYLARKLEMFSTNVFARVMEEFLRDNTTFDVADREWILEQLKASKVQRRSEYEAVRTEVERSGLNIEELESI